MKILLQRVCSASVTVQEEQIASIGKGYMLLLCVVGGDTEEQAAWLARKILGLRLFEGQDGTMNDRNVLEAGGEILLVSQFTLCGSVQKGNRPDYTAAAKPALAEQLYLSFAEHLRANFVSVQTGQFGAHMQIHLCNDGPVTLWLER